MAQAGPEDVDLAVGAARGAFDNGWSALPGLRTREVPVPYRARPPGACPRVRRARVAERRQADPRVARRRPAARLGALLLLRGWADKLEYAFPNRRPRPLGVAGQIIPWNFPLLMLAWKIAPALATGNTVVLKPAETTPLTRCSSATCCGRPSCRRASSTSSPGTGETGAELVTADVDKIAFTGSTDVGKAIRREVAGTQKKLTLELGGRQRTSSSTTRRSTRPWRGSSTASTSTRATSAVPARVCSCRSPSTRTSSASSSSAWERCVSAIRWTRTPTSAPSTRGSSSRRSRSSCAGEEEGAEIYQPACRLPGRGYWFAPAVFTEVAQSHRIAQEEIFGPVLSVLTFRTPEEAVEKANNTPYGLSAGVWTDKGSRILWMAERLGPA